MTRPCAVCGGRSTAPIYRQRFAMPSAHGVHAGYEVVACARCGFAFANDTPDQDFLDAYYRAMAKKSALLERRGYGEPEYLVRTHAKSLEHILPHVRSGDRVLDVGCYTGNLLAMLRDAVPGVHVTGLDPSALAARVAREHHGVEVRVGSLFDDLDLGEFDVVVLTHVLEHIVELRPFLARLQALLAQGGRLCVEVPDANAFWLTTDQDDPIGVEHKDPFLQFSVEHVNYFTATSLENLMRANGFAPLAVATDVSSVAMLATSWERAPLRVDAGGPAALRRYVADCDAMLQPVVAAIDALSRTRRARRRVGRRRAHAAAPRVRRVRSADDPLLRRLGSGLSRRDAGRHSDPPARGAARRSASHRADLFADVRRRDRASDPRRRLSEPRRDTVPPPGRDGAVIREPRAAFPYAGLPAERVWRRAVSALAPDEIDPQGAPPDWRFDRTTAIASAGSCFAARIAERLRRSGYRYLTTEPGSAYTARYGDVTTSLQLLQLAQRAVGAFEPVERAWERDGRFYDPFRPLATPDGFASVAALEADRREHLAAVRRMLGEADVFVFTLGLTETWCTRAGGAALPLCPGASIGTFDPDRYAYRNLTVDENVAALEAFLRIARELNPGLRLILTISPVPLAATMEERHVMQATTYSKSVLRVAAETVRRRCERVDYFASYELVAHGGLGFAGFEANRREVTEATVERVMRSFFAAYATPEPPERPTPRRASPDPARETSAAPSAPALGTFALTLEAVDARAAAMSIDEDPCAENRLARFIDAG